MAEYIAGKGTTAMGVIGTVLGSIGAAGILNGTGLNLLGNNPAQTIDYVREIENKDMELAQLRAEKYSDKSNLEVYKYFDGELKELRSELNTKFTDQAVINSTLSNGLATINNQVTTITNLVAGITKTAVPSSAICNFGCGCNPCSNGNI